MDAVHFIILNHNTSGDCETLLDSIERQLPPESYRIWIIDSGSSPGQKEELVRLGTAHRLSLGVTSTENNRGHIILLDQNVGYSRGNNVGVRAAQDQGAKYAIIANPDTSLVDAKSVSLMRNALDESTDIACVYPTIIGVDEKNTGNHQGPYDQITFARMVMGNTTVNFLQSFFRRDKRRNQAEVFTSLGCFLMVDVDKFLAVGGYDEEFFLYYEEQTLGERFQDTNLRSLLCKTARIAHHHDYSVKHPNWEKVEESKQLFLRKYKNYGRIKLAIINAAEFVRLRF